MSLREKHQNLASKYHWVLTPLLAILMGYLGVDQYKERQSTTAANVTVAVTTDASEEILSRIDVDTLIKNALEAQHAKNLVTFKQKESWEK